jgi:hypothetical protein
LAGCFRRTVVVFTVLPPTETVTATESVWNLFNSACPAPFRVRVTVLVAPAASVMWVEATVMSFVIFLVLPLRLVAVTDVSLPCLRCSVTLPTMLAAEQDPLPAEHFRLVRSLFFSAAIEPTVSTDAARVGVGVGSTVAVGW